MWAVSDEYRRAIEASRAGIDAAFQKALEERPELAEYEGHKGLSTWAYDNWEDDPA